ncbi:MAG: Gfo/Idh/MocA family oxidoreductase [Rhodospirillaceae bacterium]|nr:Gfo/Idh/MocA family oxidoreductase [Rhodospirillales bacterium]
MTRALVVGFGSIGTRHARLLAEMGHTIGIVSRRPCAHDSSYATIADGLAQFRPDYVVIANETSAHCRTLDAVRRGGFTGPILVEKPLWDVGEAPLQISGDNIFVGYNLRFHPVLIALNALLAGQNLVSAEVFCGSYLPDWRPGRDYRQTASALQAHGGGALRDLSHELDYLTWLFGPWRRVAAVGGRLSPLEIETDDVQMALIETERCRAVSLSLNYVERKPRRGLIVTTTETTLIADLEAGTLTRGQGENIGVAPFDMDETYRAQHRALLDGPQHHICNFGHALKVVTLVAAIEKAGRHGVWVAHTESEDARS